MDKDSIRNVFRLAIKYRITPREMQVLNWFLVKSWRISELVDKKKQVKMTVYHIVQKLELKKLLVIKDRDPMGAIIYEFNEELLSGSSS